MTDILSDCMGFFVKNSSAASGLAAIVMDGQQGEGVAVSGDWGGILTGFMRLA